MAVPSVRDHPAYMSTYAQVLNLLKGLQGQLYKTHGHKVQPARSRHGVDLADILTGKTPMP